MPVALNFRFFLFFFFFFCFQLFSLDKHESSFGKYFPDGRTYFFLSSDRYKNRDEKRGRRREREKEREKIQHKVDRDERTKATKSEAISGNFVPVVPGNDRLAIPENFRDYWPKDRPYFTLVPSSSGRIIRFLSGNTASYFSNCLLVITRLLITTRTKSIGL